MPRKNKVELNKDMFKGLKVPSELEWNFLVAFIKTGDERKSALEAGYADGTHGYKLKKRLSDHILRAKVESDKYLAQSVASASEIRNILSGRLRNESVKAGDLVKIASELNKMDGNYAQTEMVIEPVTFVQNEF